jgi:polyphosphate kinase 2 (PPK2 family)
MLKKFLNPNNTELDQNYYEDICEHLHLRKDFVIYDESDKMSLLR